MKKEFEAPEMEIIKFDENDVICTSTCWDEHTYSLCMPVTPGSVD